MRIVGQFSMRIDRAKFWMQVVTELKNRGVEKIYVACVDGLKGFTEAINSVFPDTTVQLCIVSMSMKIVPPVLTKIVPPINKFFYII